MYTSINFKTKKQLKEAVLAGREVTIYQPNDMSKASTSYTGTAFVEGPHYPELHRWYATVEVQNGRVVKVS